VEALKLFLYSLPFGCKFNVVSFGSSYEFLFEESLEYDDASLGKAIANIETFDADLGGTEIY
jgi:hypothetical protein